MDVRQASVSSRRLVAAAGFQLVELSNAAGLRAQFLPNGALYALRHQSTLINQLLPGPAEDGLFRLAVRWLDATGKPRGAMPLTGPQLAFGHNPRTAAWKTSTGDNQTPLECVTHFGLHPEKSAWAWRIQIRNLGSSAQLIDVLHAQDLGLADEGAVRNNEAYVSQYLDLLPLQDERLGHVVLARQNQPMQGGRRPWLGVACAQGAAAFCTDGWQFFGNDFRLTQTPAAYTAAALPSKRLQYEFAVGGLQSNRVSLAPGAVAEVVFVAHYLPDHPAASSASDLASLQTLLPATWLDDASPSFTPPALASVFTQAEWLHGATPSAADWTAWFPGAHRHEEKDSAGRILSFFTNRHTHVVSREKETLIARPHGHVVRNGNSRWIDDEQFGFTAYAAGVFQAQTYLGNPSLSRLLSVVRNHLNVARASGQRVFVRVDNAWRQLGVPSAFALDPGAVRWIYRLPDRVIEARAWCSARDSASFLDLQVLSGPPTEFLVTHQLALGAMEFEFGGELQVHADGWLAAQPASDSFLAKHWSNTCFALAAWRHADLAACGGDELLYSDGRERSGPYAVFRTKPVGQCGFILLGTHHGAGALPALVAHARSEHAVAAPGAQPPATPVQLSGTSDAAVARLNDVLPWFTQNASIHFSAPHGLEQYGGAAWGVRDVTQGSIEWLLAAGDFATSRRTLATVFEQQYSAHPSHADVAGCWPQWFMFAPFRFIQQTHSHGDVCLWPVKALCDYVEASNDLAFLDTPVGYTDPEKFAAAGPTESLWTHCDRVVAHVESRFIAGTALINYGDGDWDDTLQPADPAMRTRMVSAWTVALAYHTFRQLAAVARRAHQQERAVHLGQLLTRMRTDFAKLAMPNSVVAGFLVHESNHTFRSLLHPTDQVTHIRYRLLPMTRSMLAELFTPDEAKRHAELIEKELRFTDGVRLMSEPAVYHGGLEKLFKRADTAANVGREIGLQYVHAHIRYAEAMAKLGEAEKLWTALQVINPVGLEHAVPTAMPRQSNVYFSSSDADFAERLEAAARWPELRAGQVPVRGGWRLYSSGPGLYLHKVRASLLGIRESFGDVVFDPVLPRALDGLKASTHLMDKPVEFLFSVKNATSAPTKLTINGTVVGEFTREANPYRRGGLRVAGDVLASLLLPEGNRIEIEL